MKTGGMKMQIDEIKDQICDVCHKMWQLGWVAANDGNVSVRLDDGTFLATPTGMSKSFITPDKLLRIDASGNILEGAEGLRPSSEIKMHMRCYEKRDDVRAVVHAHPPTATGFAVAHRPMDMYNMIEDVAAIGAVPLTPYGTPSTTEVPDAIEPYLNEHDVMLLENHGALAVGSDDYSIPKSILETANAMYVDEKMKMSSSFDDLADILSNTYQASLKRCDLSSAETMNEINDWVNEKTHGLIPSILDEPMDPGIRMTLLNAVYFKAAWVNAFEKELTDKQIFHGKEGDTSVDMMHQQDHFEYAENDEYQMIRLPYHGGCEMTVYLPKDSITTDKWSEKDYLYQLGLEADKQEWDSREVSLSMPKFEMEYGNELKDILKELGLEGIFDGCIYDRLTDAEMAVGSIYHKTAIKNDENGTEAAAVTMMLMEAMALLPEDDIVEMNMDHPFYFTISNTETGLKLFEGCVYNLK